MRKNDELIGNVSAIGSNMEGIVRIDEFICFVPYALLGENGAGKTTLVSIISGIKKATDGKIIINEKILINFYTFQLLAVTYTVFQVCSK